MIKDDLYYWSEVTGIYIFENALPNSEFGTWMRVEFMDLKWHGHNANMTTIKNLKRRLMVHLDPEDVEIVTKVYEDGDELFLHSKYPGPGLSTSTVQPLSE